MARHDPADALLHPLPLAAIVLLVLNDHVLKARYPGWITGKLSDVAGLVFFPLLLGAVIARVAPSRATPWLVVWCALATAIAFTAVKTWAPATRVYELALGTLAWPIRAAALAVSGAPLPPFAPAALVRDVSDLLALPFVGAGPWLARRRGPAKRAEPDTLAP